MYKIFEKVAHIILNIIIAFITLIVIIVGYNYVQLQVMNKDYTNFLGYTVFEVSTGSMAKTLNIYDIILVKITKEVEVGDIITYKKDNELITHRIMEINGNELTTKGDANNTEDEEITKEAIIGKVVSVYSKARSMGKSIFGTKCFNISIYHISINRTSNIKWKEEKWVEGKEQINYIVK